MSEKYLHVQDEKIPQNLFKGDGEIAEIMRTKDWSQTAIGPVKNWPANLVNTINMMLNARFGMFLFWGPDHIQFYNDDYRLSLGHANEKHPHALGQKALDFWTEIWFAIGPRIERVMNEGISIRRDNHHLPIFRNGMYEDVFWTFSYSPVFGDDGSVVGVLVVEVETTHEVIITRRSGFLSALVAGFNPIIKKSILYEKFSSILPANQDDMPFSLLFIQQREMHQNVLVSSSGIENIGEVADAEQGYFAEVLNQVIQSGEPCLLQNPLPYHIDKPGSDEKQTVERIYAIPIKMQHLSHPFGVFISGINPRLHFDTEYRNFLEGIVSRLSASIQNIRTERERGEALEALHQTSSELESQKRLYDSLVRSTPDLVYVINTDFTFDFANAAILEMWGMSWEDAKGKRFIELGYEPWHAEMHEREIRQVITSKKMIRGEVSFPHAVLGRRVYDYIFAPIFDENEEVVSIAGTTRDITQLKQLERQKDYFIATASHELKTPLTSLKAYTQILQMRLENKLETEAAGMMKKMDAQIDKLTNLVNDLLDITKMESGKLKLNKQSFSINDLISEIVQEIQRTARHYTIEFNPEADTNVTGDKERIGQVLINYLTNAIKYSPGQNRIRVFSYTLDNQLVVAVEDFGLGLSSETQKHLFERFYRAEGSNQDTYPGLGIGLYISKEIIERHGGHTWAKSTYGKGSTFYFSLPLHPLVDSAS